MNRLAVYSYLTRCTYGHGGFGMLFIGIWQITMDEFPIISFAHKPEFRTNTTAAAAAAAAVTEDCLSRICSGSKRARVRYQRVPTCQSNNDAGKCLLVSQGVS